LAATFGLRPTTTTASPAGLLITDFKLAHTAAAAHNRRRRSSGSITTTSSRSSSTITMRRRRNRDCFTTDRFHASGSSFFVAAGKSFN
jgi:hypothetical protein